MTHKGPKSDVEDTPCLPLNVSETVQNRDSLQSQENTMDLQFYTVE